MGHIGYFFISIANMQYRRKLKLVPFVSDDSYSLFACLEKFICLLIFWPFEYLFVTNGTGDKSTKYEKQIKIPKSAH